MLLTPLLLLVATSAGALIRVLTNKTGNKMSDTRYNGV